MNIGEFVRVLEVEEAPLVPTFPETIPEEPIPETIPVPDEELVPA